MKIIVLGNSNSILLDGWLPAFKEADPNNSIVNLSLGGSRSPAMLYQALSHSCQFTHEHVAIVEPTVLDCGEVTGSGDIVAGHADAVLSMLKSSNVRPVLLALPRFPKHVQTPSQGMMAWSAIALKHEVPVLDGSEIIKLFGRKFGMAHDELWRDNQGHHISKIGMTIGQMMPHFLAAVIEDATPKTPEQLIPLMWRAVSGRQLAEQSGLQCRASSTALASIECAVMRAGDQINATIGPGEKILGLAINYGELNPCEDIQIQANGTGNPVTMNVKHHLLPAKVQHKARVLFRPTNFPNGYGYIQLPRIAANARMYPDKAERFEIEGILVGPDIEPISGWESTGLAALEMSHHFIESYFATYV